MPSPSPLPNLNNLPISRPAPTSKQQSTKPKSTPTTQPKSMTQWQWRLILLNQWREDKSQMPFNMIPKKNWKTRTKKIWHEHWKQKIPLLGPISGSPRLEEPSSFFQLSLSSRGYLIQSLLCQKRPSSGNQGQRVEGFNWLSVTQDNKPTKIGNWNLGLTLKVARTIDRIDH